MARLGQFRRDTWTNWTTANPILADGEYVLISLDEAPHRYVRWVCGDGISHFNDLLPNGLSGSSGVIGISDNPGDSSNIAFSELGAKGLANDIEDLGVTLWPLTADLTLSQTLIEYDGVAKVITASWNIYRQGKAETINVSTLTMTANNSATVDTPAVSRTGSTTVRNLQRGETTVTLNATSGQKMHCTKQAKVNIVLPIYYGFSTAQNASELDIVNLGNKKVQNTGKGTYTFTNPRNAQYIWICIPTNFGSSYTFKNGAGYGIAMQPVQNGSTNLGDYYCFRSSLTQDAGNYTVVLS